MTRLAPYSAAFNHTGQPAVSVPAGFTSDGFPLAAQLVGPPDSEALLVIALRAAGAGARLGCGPSGGGGMSANATELLLLAESIAREAGALLREAFRGPELRISAKSTPTDLVSEADHAAEHLIRERITAARPDDGVLGEEGGDTEGTSGIRWVVDPLDGTINFLFGVPQWAVSIAAEDSEGALVGVVYDPERDELFSASRGGQATLDGHPITASTKTDMATALIGTGFGYDSEVRRAQAAVVARLLPDVRDIRRFGAAAIDLAWTACGRLDAYYEHGLNAWDLAAGGLICECAGLEVRHVDPVGPSNPGVIVGPPILVDALGPRAGVKPRRCWVWQTHAHRRRHRPLCSDPDPRLPVPQAVAASPAWVPEGVRPGKPRRQQGPGQARPLAEQAVQLVQQDGRQVRLRGPQGPRQDAALDVRTDFVRAHAQHR